MEKICPVCKLSYQSRWERQVCCGRSCARVLDNQRSGPRGWKGGRNKTNHGYMKVLAKGHHRADANGYALEHLIVMERELGRELQTGERVHHRNGIRDDNRPENLELWTVAKDPPGQRAIDRARHWLRNLTQAERAMVMKEFQCSR